MNTIGLSSLESVAVLYRGDFHQLASVMVRVAVERDKTRPSAPNTTSRSRPTVHGIAGHFASIAQMSQVDVERRLRASGLSPGAVVVLDEEVPHWPSESPRS